MSQRKTAKAMQAHMRRYETSGLTAVSYCHKYNFPQATFYYWRRKLSLIEQPAFIQFQEIKLLPNTDAPIISIQYGHDITVRIEGPVSASFIRELTGC